MSTGGRPTLTPLWAYWDPPRADRVLVAPLAAAVGLDLASMRLPWHHIILSPLDYTVVTGVMTDSWLIVVAALSALVAVRFLIAPPGPYSRWLLTAVCAVVFIGLFSDYVDWQARAAQVNFGPAYFGPGWYVALAGAAAQVAAAVLAWLRRQ